MGGVLEVRSQAIVGVAGADASQRRTGADASQRRSLSDAGSVSSYGVLIRPQIAGILIDVVDARLKTLGIPYKTVKHIALPDIPSASQVFVNGISGKLFDAADGFNHLVITNRGK